MAGKTRFLKTNFSSGELGPRVLARVDLTKYYNGAKRMRNVLIFKTGGAPRRPGLRLAGAVNDHDQSARLQRFEFNVEQAYIIELGDQYVRFWKNGRVIESAPLVPYEVASSYLEADLFDLTFQQSADVLYIGGEPSYPPSKLSRVADTDWTLSAINFRPPPSAEKPLALQTTLTLSATTGNGETATLGAALALPADKDRLITAGAGRAVITAVDPGLAEYTIDILDPFSTTGPIAADSWHLRGSPQADLDFNKARPVNGAVTGALKAVDGGGDLDAIRADDVGKFIKGLGGLVKITEVVDEHTIKGIILNILKDAPETPRNPAVIPAGAWTLESEAWTAEDGYPGSPLFHEDRLFWARQQTLWGSKSGDYENQARGSADDDAVEYRLSTNTVDFIQWLASDDVKLYPGTAGGVHSLTGGGNDGEPLTPNPPRRRRVVSDRAANIPPIIADGAVLFVERSRTLFKEIRFDWEEDRQRSFELTDLNEVILSSGAKQVAYQSVPDPRAWIVRQDGKIVTLTYYRKEDVIGWTVIETQGLFESVAIIPHPDGDREQVWTIVQRDINGVIRRFVEYFDDKAPEKNIETWPHKDKDGNPVCSLYTDCAVVQTPATDVTEIANLTHLMGESVYATVNGANAGRFTVDETGRIPLTARAGDVVEVGLPYSHIIETQPPEMPQAQTIQAAPKRWSDIWIRVLDTCAAKVQGKPVTFIKGGNLMDTAPPLFTGIKQVTDFGVSEEGTITIEDDLPQPFTLLSVFGNLNVGDQ